MGIRLLLICKFEQLWLEETIRVRKNCLVEVIAMSDQQNVRAIHELYNITGKIALVTGGYGLYGRWLSQTMAEAGAHTIIASRNLAQCEAYAAELREAGYSASGAELDQGCEESIIALRDYIDAEFGQLDIFVNNAVGRFPVDDLLKTETNYWPDYMQVNATGVLLISKHIGKYMYDAGSGSIINISSIYGLVGPTFPIYQGSPVISPAEYAFVKGGMTNLTRYMATLLAPKVRVNAIAPGGLESGQDWTFREKYLAHCPLARLAGPEDIKGPALFLASDAAQYVTGQIIAVDGGWTAW